MNIAIFTNAYKPVISGVVNSIDMIRSAMEKNGHRVHVIAPAFKGFSDTERNIHRFPSVSLTNRVKFPVAIPWSPAINRKIPEMKLDVIHAHHPFLLGVVGARFARKLNIPLAFTFHTQYEQYTHYFPFPQSFLKKFTRNSVIKFANGCDSIICPSDTILSLIEDYGIKSRVDLLPNAINTEHFRGADPEPVRKKFGLNGKQKLFIYVGRMGAEKNIPFMMESFRKVMARVPETRLMIVGEGPELENFRSLSRKMEIADRTFFPGRVEYSDIPAYYACAHAFAITSTTEVRPLAILEAMSAGLPVVAVSAPGASDTLRNGYDGLLTGEDVEEYSSAVLNLLENPEKRERLSQGARQTSDRFSSGEYAHRLENLFHDIIRKKRNGGSGS